MIANSILPTWNAKSVKEAEGKIFLHTHSNGICQMLFDYKFLWLYGHITPRFMFELKYFLALLLQACFYLFL